MGRIATFQVTPAVNDAITMSLLRQNDVATSFWRNNDVIIASCARWTPHLADSFARWGMTCNIARRSPKLATHNVTLMRAFHPFLRNMFPYGLPAQFSFVSTVRLGSRARREVWDLLRIEDSLGQPQFGITLDGNEKTIELYMPNYDNRIQRLVFPSNRDTKKVCICFLIKHLLTLKTTG